MFYLQAWSSNWHYLQQVMKLFVVILPQLMILHPWLNLEKSTPFFFSLLERKHVHWNYWKSSSVAMKTIQTCPWWWTMLEWQDQLVDFLVTLYFETACPRLDVMPGFPDVSEKKNTIKVRKVVLTWNSYSCNYNAAKRRLDNQLYGGVAIGIKYVCKLQWFWTRSCIVDANY